MDKETLLEWYRQMVLIRRFEQRSSELYQLGKIAGFLHLSQGQEAVPVGTCTALREDDYITSTHRGHGDVIAKGCDVKFMFAELYGRTTGYCKGKGGSMHIADPSLGILGANGIVGGGIVVMVLPVAFLFHDPERFAGLEDDAGTRALIAASVAAARVRSSAAEP